MESRVLFRSGVRGSCILTSCSVCVWSHQILIVTPFIPCHPRLCLQHRVDATDFGGHLPSHLTKHCVFRVEFILQSSNPGSENVERLWLRGMATAGRYFEHQKWKSERTAGNEPDLVSSRVSRCSSGSLQGALLPIS